MRILTSSGDLPLLFIQIMTAANIIAANISLVIFMATSTSLHLTASEVAVNAIR